MAVITIPQTAEEQPDESQTLTGSSTVAMTRSFKDAYATLKTFANGIVSGDTVGANGPRVVSYQLRRRPGNLGILTLSLAPNDTETSGEEASQSALLETWSLKSVRNDVSLFAYCGPSEGNDPNRVRLELWLKETDAALAKDMKFRRTDDDKEGEDLTDADKLVAEKFLKGYDSVIRVYPLLTKTRVYSAMPSTVYENLCTVDTPAVTESSKVKETPGNLSSVITDHSWLKVQDDCEKNSDGTFSRVESWMGVLLTERSWDANFYGTGESRWPMPKTTGNGGAGGQ